MIPGTQNDWYLISTEMLQYWLFAFSSKDKLVQEWHFKHTKESLILVCHVSNFQSYHRHITQLWTPESKGFAPSLPEVPEFLSFQCLPL